MDPSQLVLSIETSLVDLACAEENFSANVRDFFLIRESMGDLQKDEMVKEKKH